MPLQIVRKIKLEEKSFMLEVKIESFKAIEWNLPSSLHQNKINIICTWINYFLIVQYSRHGNLYFQFDIKWQLPVNYIALLIISV